jgi:hypothetical protein
MTSLTEGIVEKLQQLPEPDLREILTFIDFGEPQGKRNPC